MYDSHLLFSLYHIVLVGCLWVAYEASSFCATNTIYQRPSLFIFFIQRGDLSSWHLQRSRKIFGGYCYRCYGNYPQDDKRTSWAAGMMDRIGAPGLLLVIWILIRFASVCVGQYSYLDIMLFLLLFNLNVFWYSTGFPLDNILYWSKTLSYFTKPRHFKSRVVLLHLVTDSVLHFLHLLTQTINAHLS